MIGREVLRGGKRGWRRKRGGNKGRRRIELRKPTHIMPEGKIKTHSSGQKAMKGRKAGKAKHIHFAKQPSKVFALEWKSSSSIEPQRQMSPKAR